MTTRPTITGSVPSSPPLSRFQIRRQMPAGPLLRISRSSAMSAATAETVASASGSLTSLIRGSLRVCSLRCPRGAGGDDVVAGSGDGGDQLLGGSLLDGDPRGVPAEPHHHDAIGHGLDVGHVVADQDDAETRLTQPLDE